MKNRIVIASGKGGVGKSTIAAGLGRVAAQNGHKTLLIDCDTGLGSLDILFGCTEKCAFNWMDVYENRCKPEQAIVPLEKKLDLLPVPRSLQTDLPDEAVCDFIEKYTETYEYVFIDAPAGIDSGLLRAAKGATRALVIAIPDAVSVRGAWSVARTLEQNGIRQQRLIINRFQYKAVRHRRFFNVDDSVDKTGVQLIGIVPEDEKLPTASVTGKFPGKGSASAKAFARIMQRINGKQVSLKISSLK